MKNRLVIILTLATALLPSALHAEETNQWTFDVSLYGLVAGMSGNVAFKGIPADVDWQISKLASVQVGYRFLYTDYETGSGLNRFKYDMLTSGPQVGFTLHF